jgi:hypothetical protein
MAAAAKDPSSVPRFAAARAYDGAAAPDPSALDASRRDGPTLFSLRFR